MSIHANLIIIFLIKKLFIKNYLTFKDLSTINQSSTSTLAFPLPPFFVVINIPQNSNRFLSRTKFLIKGGSDQ